MSVMLHPGGITLIDPSLAALHGTNCFLIAIGGTGLAGMFTTHLLENCSAYSLLLFLGAKSFPPGMPWKRPAVFWNASQPLNTETFSSTAPEALWVSHSYPKCTSGTPLALWSRQSLAEAEETPALLCKQLWKGPTRLLLEQQGVP